MGSLDMPQSLSIADGLAYVIDHAAQLLVALFGILCSGIFTVVIYRLKFHPLARFPGPFLAKLSDLYPAYYSARGEGHLQIWLAHQKYGPIVRFGPSKLVFNSATGLNEIYVAGNLPKSKGYEAMLPVPGAHNVHTCIDKSLHRRKRKVLSQGFSEQAIRTFEPTILKSIDVFLRQIALGLGKAQQKEWTEPINMTDRCKYLTLDLMGEFVFGHSFELQTKEDNRFLIDTIRVASTIVGAYAQYPKLKNVVVDGLLKLLGSWTRQKFGQPVKELMERRLAVGKNAKPDLFSFIIDAKDPETGKGFSLNELWAESRFLIIAGSDTTATAMSSLLFYLSRYPACYSKLTTSIRQIYMSSKDIRSGTKVAKCSYLRACIDESLRMSPPVGTALWREVGKNGILIDGEYIASGMEVGIGLYSLHHNEASFPDSFVFRPERWLETAESNVDKKAQAQMQASFQPFSLGSRKCAAQSFAYAELSLAIAKLLWFFDFRRPSDTSNSHLDKVGAGTENVLGPRGHVLEFQLEEHLTGVHDGPWLEWKLRDDIDFEKELAGLDEI